MISGIRGQYPLVPYLRRIEVYLRTNARSEVKGQLSRQIQWIAVIIRRIARRRRKGQLIHLVLRQPPLRLTLAVPNRTDPQNLIVTAH